MFKSIMLTILICFLSCFVQAQDKKNIDTEESVKTEISKNEQAQLIEKLNAIKRSKKLNDVRIDTSINQKYFIKTIIGRDFNNPDTLREILRKSVIFDYNIDLIQTNFSELNNSDLVKLQKSNLELSNCLSDTTFNRIIAFHDPKKNEKLYLLFIKNFINIEKISFFSPIKSDLSNDTTPLLSVTTLHGLSLKKHIKYSSVKEIDLPILLTNKDYYFSIANEIPLEGKHFSFSPQFDSGYVIVFWDDNKEILTIYP
jgi:hypothetical protein